MAELAPGFFVSGLVPQGEAIVIEGFDLGLGPGTKRYLAMHPDDWERLPGWWREKFLDELIEEDAEAGLRRLRRALRVG